jgi:U6 snRNA-associated Sm-like protein LSm2
VTVELKNDIQIRGILKSVDQYLNIKLDNIQVLEEIKYPHMVSDSIFYLLPYLSLSFLRGARVDGLTRPPLQSAVKNVFIRGSVVRYVHLPASAVDIPLLEDATRREAANQAATKAK